jgi:hypothetical protein
VVVPQGYDFVETAAAPCGWSIAIRNEEKPWIMPFTDEAMEVSTFLNNASVLAVVSLPARSLTSPLRLPLRVSSALPFIARPTPLGGGGASTGRRDAAHTGRPSQLTRLASLSPPTALLQPLGLHYHRCVGELGSDGLRADGCELNGGGGG